MLLNKKQGKRKNKLRLLLPQAYIKKIQLQRELDGLINKVFYLTATRLETTAT